MTPRSDIMLKEVLKGCKAAWKLDNGEVHFCFAGQNADRQAGDCQRILNREYMDGTDTAALPQATRFDILDGKRTSIYYASIKPGTWSLPSKKDEFNVLLAELRLKDQIQWYDNPPPETRMQVLLEAASSKSNTVH